MRGLFSSMYKKHSSFSFIALLFVPRLSEHERPGAIEMLKAGVRVSGGARYYTVNPLYKDTVCSKLSLTLN